MVFLSFFSTLLPPASAYGLMDTSRGIIWHVCNTASQLLSSHLYLVSLDLPHIVNTTHTSGAANNKRSGLSSLGDAHTDIIKLGRWLPRSPLYGILEAFDVLTEKQPGAPGFKSFAHQSAASNYGS